MKIFERVSALLSDDALQTATEEAKAHVKANPQDKEGRFLLIDLLVLIGDYERADRQVTLAATFSPNDAMGLSLLRNELRGMFARDAWFTSGAIPAFPGGPTACDQAAVRLNIADREGDGSEARRALDAIEELRGQRPMSWNDRAVDDFRDLDDRIPHALEVITTGGAYLWIDYARLASLKLEPIARPRDLAFRRAELKLVDGAVASVLIPAIYPDTRGEDGYRLGRQTDWIEKQTGLTIGLGQRSLLVGDVLAGFHETVTLAPAPISQDAGRVLLA